jgi:hypothetical protein
MHIMRLWDLVTWVAQLRLGSPACLRCLAVFHGIAYGPCVWSLVSMLVLRGCVFAICAQLVHISRRHMWLQQCFLQGWAGSSAPPLCYHWWSSLCYHCGSMIDLNYSAQSTDALLYGSENHARCVYARRMHTCVGVQAQGESGT